MKELIDKVNFQNLEENYNAKKIYVTKKIPFNAILNKKKQEQDKKEDNKLFKAVKTYYITKLKRKTFFIILNEYYKSQSILYFFKLKDIDRKRKWVFYSLLKNKLQGKIKRCVMNSLNSFTDATTRFYIKLKYFNILKKNFLNTKGIYLKIKKKRINSVIINIFYKWLDLSLKCLHMKYKKAKDYYILRKKRRIFNLWKRMINDKKFFKKIDIIFFKLEEIAYSWEQK
ncbi:conserved Plasmodium protein, unknown function [Plasmodium sp. gorilla clade G2]|uniref:conserved Plasmodium protein, unknown function n=1 Tax=Plasmodium sp. gorilla clade G2 TaxID=880535 RepID=UPI000D221221|nr:conserved Plasmodium protein, unknown function [Plasmodium sp. gorilla clade G2]SOV19374.1 conserved Plasmodium protein, unknown function [Plasmodium sp. gorilla clade G2]